MKTVCHICFLPILFLIYSHFDTYRSKTVTLALENQKFDNRLRDLANKEASSKALVNESAVTPAGKIIGNTDPVLPVCHLIDDITNAEDATTEIEHIKKSHYLYIHHY